MIHVKVYIFSLFTIIGHYTFFLFYSTFFYLVIDLLHTPAFRHPLVPPPYGHSLSRAIVNLSFQNPYFIYLLCL